MPVYSIDIFHEGKRPVYVCLVDKDGNILDVYKRDPHMRNLMKEKRNLRDDVRKSSKV
jgi:hypothetical protein